MNRIVFAALLVERLVGAQNSTSTTYNPVNSMCMRWDHQSVIKNDALYIYGGVQTFATNTDGELHGQTAVNGYNFDLIKVDMTQSWDWKVNISESIISVLPDPNTGNPPPFVVDGALYQGGSNDDNFYLYGGTDSYFNTSFPGWAEPLNWQYSLWSYDISTSAWGQHDVTAYAPHRPSSGFAAEAPDQGLAFYANGELNNGSELQSMSLGPNHDVFLSGMVVINTTTQTAQNLSTAGFSGSNPRTRGGMVYVPNYGNKGILVAMGGTYKPVGSNTSAESAEFSPLSEISIYDIDSVYNGNSSAGWYTQNATGAIPDLRSDFCIVLISAPDNSTHNIYLYGGRGPQNATYDDIYVLSLPSFTWTQVYFKGASPRWGHTCHVVGNAQMLTVGGAIDEGCDWELKGVAILNLTSLNWGSVFTYDDNPYAVPALVQKTIGGGNTSEPAMTAPLNGYQDPSLLTLFTTHPSITSTSPATKSSASASSGFKHPHIGAIIGGVVGGVLGAALLVALSIYLFWLRPRRLSAAKAKAKDEEDHSSDFSLDPSSRMGSELADTSPRELSTAAANVGIGGGGGERVELHGTERREIDGREIGRRPPTICVEKEKEDLGPVELPS